MKITQGYYRRRSGTAVLDKVSVGLYLDALPLRAIVLTKLGKKWRFLRKYEWMPTDIHHLSIPNFNNRNVTVEHWCHFLHYIKEQLRQDPLALFECKQLLVSVGVDYQSCAWLPIPQLTHEQSKSPNHTPMMHWKRSAATHWQVDPQDVWVDVLVLGKEEGLLGSVPRQTLQGYVDSIGILQPLSRKPVQVSLSSHLDCLLQIWPWYTRRCMALLNLHENQATYFNKAGIHTIDLAQLPNHITHMLLCGDDESVKHHGLAPSIKLWHWRIANLKKQWLIPWHLAFVPPLTINNRSRPLAAWQTIQ